MANRTHVHMGLRPFKFGSGHGFLLKKHGMGRER